jgi:hypothetical protein
VSQQEATWVGNLLKSEEEKRYWVNTDPGRTAPYPTAPFAAQYPKRPPVYTIGLLFKDALFLFPKGKPHFLSFGTFEASHPHLATIYNQVGLAAFKLVDNSTFLDCLIDPTFLDLERYRKIGLLLISKNKEKSFPTPITPSRLKGSMKPAEPLYTLNFSTFLKK